MSLSVTYSFADLKLTMSTACKPGIYIPFPPPFAGFPRITIGFDGIPTAGPSDEPVSGEPTSNPTSKATSSSSGKCTTKTASDCAVQCIASPTVVSGKTSFSSTCKTTCSRTVGCPEAPTTTTSTNTTSGSTEPIVTLTAFETLRPLVDDDNIDEIQEIIAADASHMSMLGISYQIPSFSSTLSLSSL